MAKIDGSEASFWHKERSGIRCDLCSWKCFIPKGKLGYCEVRKNVGNVLYSLNYGKVASYGMTSIEDVPIYHFYPGSKTLFVQTVGSSFKLDFKEAPKNGKDVPVGKMVREIVNSKTDSVTFGGGDPTVEMEYAIEIMKVNKKGGVANILVTNGFATNEINKRINKILDAVTVEIYGSFDRDFYRKHCAVNDIKPIRIFLKQMKKHRIHTEISNIIIPHIGDDLKAFRKFVEFIVSEVDAHTPLHLTLLNTGHAPKATIHFLEKYYQEAKSGGLRHIFARGLDGRENTICYNCNHTVIKRADGVVKEIDLIGDRCPSCGLRINVIMNK